MERFHCRFTTLILRVLQITASHLRICRFSVNKVDEKVMINYCVKLTVIIFTSLLHQSHSLVINAHHCHCTDKLLLVFIMMVVLLLPHCSAQTEWEDDGEQLHRSNNNNSTDHQVQVLLDVPGQLVEASSVDVGVAIIGALNTVWILRLQQCLVSGQDTAGLGNLKIFQVSTKYEKIFMIIPFFQDPPGLIVQQRAWQSESLDNPRHHNIPCAPWSCPSWEWPRPCLVQWCSRWWGCAWGIPWCGCLRDSCTRCREPPEQSEIMDSGHLMQGSRVHASADHEQFYIQQL